MKIKCEECSHKEGKVKNIKTGSQRYKCKHCRKIYTPVQKVRIYGKEIVDRAIELYIEGNSGRAVGQTLKISKNTCLNWIYKRAKMIAPKNRSNERVEIIEDAVFVLYLLFSSLFLTSFLLINLNSIFLSLMFSYLSFYLDSLFYLLLILISLLAFRIFLYLK